MSDLDEQEKLILDSVARFLERHVRPVASKLEHEDAYPHEIVAQMKEMGLFGAIIPQEFGGLGLRPSTYARIIDSARASCRNSQPAHCAAGLR